MQYLQYWTPTSASSKHFLTAAVTTSQRKMTNQDNDNTNTNNNNHNHTV